MSLSASMTFYLVGCKICWAAFQCDGSRLGMTFGIKEAGFIGML